MLYHDQQYLHEKEAQRAQQCPAPTQRESDLQPANTYHFLIGHVTSQDIM